MDTPQVDVVVVGAGLAGLAAARRLVEAGASVAVVEARERVGGRTHTLVHEGATIDVGGQWIGPGQPRMLALARELGVATFPTPLGGKQVLDLAGTLSSYAGTIPKVGIAHLLQLQLALTLIERIRKGVPPEAPWDAPGAAALDGQTLLGWVRRHLPSSVVRQLLTPTVRTVFGADPGELSMLHFAHYVASAGGFMPLVDTEGGFQELRLVDGAQAFSEGLADRVGRERVHLGRPVRGVSQDDDGVTVHTDDGDLRGGHAIVAMPLGLLDRLRWAPALPPLRDQLHQRCPMGATVKVFCAYARPFWRDAGLSGEAVCTEGPISVVFDNTAPGGPPMLLAFVTGTPARDWASRPQAARLQAVLDLLARYFGPEAATPVWTHEQDWVTDPWAGGCPITLFPPGTLSVFGPVLREPVGRVHWAGTETATRCTGFMEGAVTSGERAADEVIAARR
ncbi:MAG: FAD-dependent oxidoreductase [Alphaproteobacteria bacterium]|nr:FAD-dependent oxidoreductase [Alphaproteobacteria bacterium]